MNPLTEMIVAFVSYDVKIPIKLLCLLKRQINSTEKSFFISQNSALAMTRKRNDSSEICQLNEMYNRWFLNVDVKEIPSIEVLSFYWCAAAFILGFSLFPIQKRSHLAVLPNFFFLNFVFLFHVSRFNHKSYEISKSIE